MRVYSEKSETKMITTQKLEKIICDWCEKEFKEAKGYDSRDFSFTSGSSYGNDGGHKRGWEIEDMCDDCVKKLRLLLEENGIKIAKVDISW